MTQWRWYSCSCSRCVAVKQKKALWSYDTNTPAFVICPLRDGLKKNKKNKQQTRSKFCQTCHLSYLWTKSRQKYMILQLSNLTYWPSYKTYCVVWSWHTVKPDPELDSGRPPLLSQHCKNTQWVIPLHWAISFILMKIYHLFKNLNTTEEDSATQTCDFCFCWFTLVCKQKI